MTVSPKGDYPDLEPEIAGYQPSVHYDGSEAPPLVIPGGHETFAAACHRARRIAEALRGAGETGITPWVVVSGERPAGFPRNGVRV